MNRPSMDAMKRALIVALIAGAAAMSITFLLFPPISPSSSMTSKDNATLTVSKADRGIEQTVAIEVVDSYPELRSAIVRADSLYLNARLCAESASPTQLIQCPSIEYSTEISKQNALSIIQDDRLYFSTISEQGQNISLTYVSTIEIEGKDIYSISIILSDGL